MYLDSLEAAMISCATETEEQFILTTLFYSKELCKLFRAVLPIGIVFFFSYTFPKAQIISSDHSADTTTFLVVYISTFLFFITEHVSIISVVFQTAVTITISIARIQHYFLMQDWWQLFLNNFIQETQITITFHIDHHIFNDPHLACLRYLPITNKYQ